MIQLTQTSPANKVASTNITNRIIRSLSPLQQMFRNQANSDPDAAIETIWVKPTSLVDDQTGIYNGKSFALEIKNEVDGDLAEEDIGKLSDKEDVEIWNVPEIYGGGALDLNKAPILCRHVNYRSKDAKLIVLFLGDGGGSLPKGRVQYTYLGCTAQNSPPAYDYIRTHAQS